MRGYTGTVARVFVGIGSNIDPERNLREAARILREHWPGIQFSSVYRTAPREINEQPDFLNAVAVFETEETPEKVFAVLQEIEHVLGKSPPFRFGPRSIDLDFLLYNDRTLATPACALSSLPRLRRTSRAPAGRPELTIPHPRMHKRRFVLEPLCELLKPEAKHLALGESWRELLSACLDQRCDRTELVLYDGLPHGGNCCKTPTGNWGRPTS